MGDAGDSESAERRGRPTDRRWLLPGDACEAGKARDDEYVKEEEEEDEADSLAEEDEGIDSGDSSVLGEARNLRMWLGMENVDSDADAASGLGRLDAELARGKA